MLTDGRLGVPPARSLTEHVHEVQLASEREAVQEFVDMDLAHIVMLGEQAILSSATAGPVLRALLEIAEPAGRDALVIDPSRGSMLLQIEAFLAERCGPAAGMLQLARSRIDQSAEAMRLVARRGTVRVMASLLDLGRTQLEAAARFDAQPVPGYTHFQHSQPTTLGHYLNAQYFSTSRDLDRLEQALERIDLCALGGVALSGTGWPIDRARTAELLGHRGIVANARDAGVFSLDVSGELASVLALAANGLGRVAGDLLFWSSSEVRLLRLDPALCGTSSMMPQKRNPYALERIRAVAGESAGWQATQLGLLKLATSTDGDILFTRDATPVMCQEVVGSATLMRDCLEGLEVDGDAMRRSAGAQWSSASALVDALVGSRGLSFREAHDIVARLVRRSEERGIEPERVTASDLSAAASEAGHDLDAASVDLAAVLNLDRFLATRVSTGAAGPDARRELADLAAADLAAHRKAFDEIEESIRRSRGELLRAARELAGVAPSEQADPG